MTRQRKAAALVLALAGSSASVAAELQAVDWANVPTTTLALFYPAQSTYQWLRSPAHPGALAVGGGGACVTCHKGAEQRLGDKLVKANPLEPTPIEGKNGSLELRVQVAYDDENAYFRFQ